MKKLLALTLALMLLLSAAAVVHAEDVEIIYMASQDWVQDAEMELAENARICSAPRPASPTS